MAILWQRQVLGTNYEVRSAGQTRRLYTDGVFHSQYNPRNPVTGSIWDLLLLPAFFFPKEKVRRILVLGVGGGAVIQQFKYFLEPEYIVGVELNPNHLYVARNYFGVTHSNVKLVEADAKRWVENYRGQPFDLVVDDLFAEQDGEPVRAIEVNGAWFKSLSKIVSGNGGLVFNFVSSKQLRECAYFHNKLINNQYKSAFRLSAPAYENAIGVFLKISSSTGVLKKNLVAIPKLNPDRKTSRLRYHAQRL